MGNYRQHIAFASTLGVGYGVAAYALAGLHWLYGSVAILLASLGGLLPDLDSASGIELRGFTGILGVLGALVVWQEVGQIQPPPVFEIHLWAMVGTFLAIRHGLKRIMLHITMHRGISHSLPTCAVWAELVYLHYPSESHPVRLMMGAGVAIGFFSHLLLDEICSVDLRGARLNKAFGTAIKFWAPSIWSTLAMYGLLSYLTWLTIRQWPDDPMRHDASIAAPEWPANWPRPKWPKSWGPSPFDASARREPDAPRRRMGEEAHPPEPGPQPGDGPGRISDFQPLDLPEPGESRPRKPTLNRRVRP